MYKASFVSFEKQNIFFLILIKMPLVLGVTLVTSVTKKSYRTKIYENHDRINEI
jgi:hypothetical protein